MPVRRASFAICVALTSSIFYLVLHYVTDSINNAVKKPYMDEIFHIPQAQRYCQYNFTYYDTKLTTPPGLYILAYIRIWLRDIILLRKSEIVCDTLDLRRTNHLIAISNFVTIVFIQISSGSQSINLNRKYGFRQRVGHTLNHSTTLDLLRILLTSVAIILLPPLFFFNSLFYTDAGSLLFTLLAYLFSINDHHILGSLFGIVSILFRQTNIVWLFYSACLLIFRVLEEHEQNLIRDGKPSDYYQVKFYDEQLIWNLVRKCSPYVLVGFMFILFVITNKGIVLGDKEAHQPKFHSAQALYFLGFCSIFGANWIFKLRVLKRFLYFTIRSPILALIASTLIIYLTTFGRYAHPYLLADNRHLTFYIWRRILDRHNSYVPYLLTPIYLLTSFSIWHHLKAKGSKQLVLYIICTLLVTVPNGLLEPRYFIIPFIFLRLNIESRLSVIFSELSQNLAIIIFMHYLFIHKTFRWTDSSEIQRIMW